MGNCLSAVYITYQCIILDYCFEESINASLDLCDKVYINDGKSTDGTLDVLYGIQNKFGKDRIVIVERDWNHDRAFWADERNYLLDIIPKDDYVLNIGADECFHEKDFDKIRSTINNLNKKALQFNAVHFYGRPTHIIAGPNWAEVLTKIWRNNLGIRYYNRPGGCADDPLWPNGAPVHFINCVNKGIKVYHYGHARKPMCVGIKNVKADKLYQGSDEFKDGSLPDINSYDYMFESFIKSGALRVFKETHPKYMEKWIDKHKNQETFWRKDSE